jgi:hypothetical protein
VNQPLDRNNFVSYLLSLCVTAEGGFRRLCTDSSVSERTKRKTAVARSTLPLVLYNSNHSLNVSQDEAVRSGLGYGMDCRGILVRFSVEARHVVPIVSRLSMGPNKPPIQWLSRALSPGVERQGREPNHICPTRPEV